MSKAGAAPDRLPGASAAKSSKLEAVEGWARPLELAILLGCLAYAAWFWIRLPGKLPSDADYLALQAAVQNQARTGDGAAVLPFWADHAKVYLHGISVLGLPQLEADFDAERYPRLWVVAQPDLPRSDAADTLRALRQRLDLVQGPQRFGPLELWLFAPKAGRAATYDFVAHAGEAQVQAAAGLRVEWREFDFLPRRCIVARAGQASLHFEGVPVHGGIRIGLGAMGPGGAEAVASIDGHALQPFRLIEGGSSFQEAELPAGSLSGDSHAVDLSVVGIAVCLDAVAY